MKTINDLYAYHFENLNIELPWRNSELSEIYEFASENARNAVIELQE
jgi:hypothetical protein